MAKVLTFTACAAAVGVALYAAAGYIGVPYAARTAIEKIGSETLGRQIQLESVSFSPWTWVFELKGLVIPEEGSDPLLSLDLLRVDASSQTLTKLAPVLDEITVDGLRINAVVNEKNRKQLESLLGSSGTDAAGSSESASAPAESSTSESGLPKLALYNISITNSSLRYQDTSQGIDESLTDLTVKLPFISTMESSGESLVTPELSMKLNGSEIQAAGTTKPFGSSLEAQLNLRVKNLDAARLARILPQMRSDALTLAGASLSSDLNFTFRNATGGNPAKMLLSGSASLAGVSVTQSGKAIVTLPNASVNISELDITNQNAAVESVTVTGLDIRASQSSQGINLLKAAESLTGTGGSSDAAASSASAGGSSAAASDASSAWKWSVASAQLKDAKLSWSDSTVKPAASITVRGINVTAKDFSSEKGKSGSFTASLEALGGKLSASGTASIAPLSVNASAKGSGLTLTQLASYVKPSLGADLTASTAFDVKASYDGSDAKASGTVTVSNFSLKQGKTTLASAKTASVKLGSLSTAARTAKVDLISVASPQINAVMTKSGINFAQLGGSSGSSAKDAKSSKTADAGKDAAAKSGTASEPAWSWELSEASVTGGTLRYRDESISPAASVEIPNLNLTVKGLSSKEGAKSTIAYSSGLGGGKASASGSFVLSPLSADIDIKGSAIGLKPFSALMQGYAGIGAKNGTLESAGKLSLKTQKEKTITGWKGDVSLASLDLTNAKGSTLMSWSKASLTGMDVETTDPIRIVIAKAEIDQPAEKQTKNVKQAASAISAISSLFGKDKVSEKIDKYSEKIPTKFTLENIRYENGRFSASGVSAASLEGVILQKLSDAMGDKLGTGTTGTASKK